MRSSDVLTVFIILLFLPPIRPVFFAYFLPKCINLFTNLSIIWTSAFFNRWYSCLPKLIGIIAGSNAMTFFSPVSWISISPVFHLLNNSITLSFVPNQIISLVFLSFHTLVLLGKLHLL